MHRFVCVGLSHKTCPVEFRERIAFAERELPDALRELIKIDGVRECMILSTCNRVEVYARCEENTAPLIIRFVSEFHGLNPDDLRQYFYTLRGEAVGEHLFRVACGLDSMVVGENEIYGQLKNAFRHALELETVDSLLYQLTERALRTGKKVRTQTKISQGAVSVSSVAVELAEKIFGKLTGERVLVIGTGEMSEKTIECLVKEGVGKIVVASRTYERALDLAQKFGAEPIRFDEWLSALRTSDIVISSTSSQEPIVKFDDVNMVMQDRKNQPLFFIDIAVPRNIESAIQSIDDVYLYDIDDLQSVISSNVRERKKEIERCEKIIDEEIEQFKGWIDQLDIKPVLQWMVNHFDQICEEEIKKAAQSLSGKENQVRDLLMRIRKKMFHRPLERLKKASLEGTLARYLQLLRELFSDEPHRQELSEEKTREKVA